MVRTGNHKKVFVGRELVTVNRVPTRKALSFSV